MSNTYTTKRRRGRPAAAAVTSVDVDEVEVSESINDAIVGDPEHLTLQQRAINIIKNLGDIPAGIERWAIAYKNAGSVLMHQYEMGKGTYQLIDLFDWLMMRGKILFGEVPKIGDIIFLEANGFMCGGKIVESILEINRIVPIPSSLPVWMIDSFKKNTRGMEKEFEITAYEHEPVIKKWYAIARIDK